MRVRYKDTVSRVLQLLLSALSFCYGLSLLFRRPLPLEKLQCLLVPFILAMNGTRVGGVVFEGCDDERSVFIWHVEFHVYSLASPPPTIVVRHERVAERPWRAAESSGSLSAPPQAAEIPSSMFANGVKF